MESSEKSLLDSIQILPEQMSQLIERYEMKIQKLINDAKITKNELEAKYEVKIADLLRTIDQVKDSLEGEKLVHEELLDELNAKCLDLEDLLETARQDLEKLGLELEETKVLLETEQKLAGDRKDQVNSLTSELLSVTLERNSFSQELDHCRDTLSQTRENVNTLLSDKKTLEAQLSESVEEVSKLEAVIDDLNLQVQTLQKKNEENTDSLNILLGENTTLKEKLEAITGISMRNRKIFDEHVKRAIENNQKSIDTQGQTQLENVEKTKTIAILTGEIESLKSQIEEAKAIKRDFEKEKKKIRLEVEAELRKKNFVSTVQEPVIEKVEKEKLVEVKKEIEPMLSSASSPSIITSSKKDKRKSVGKQYFSEDQPFCKDLVNERCNSFSVEDLLSIEALADAVVNKILRESPKHRLCYICKDISKKKCDYLSKGNKWSRDKNMAFFKECVFPALVKLANKFMAEERMKVLPDDCIIASLLSLISKIKVEKSFFEELKNYLVTKISYSE